jgi:hypothetical protein
LGGFTSELATTRTSHKIGFSAEESDLLFPDVMTKTSALGEGEGGDSSWGGGEMGEGALTNMSHDIFNVIKILLLCRKQINTSNYILISTLKG